VPLPVDENIASELTWVSPENRHSFSPEKSLEIEPENTRMPGSENRSFEPVGPIDRTIEVKQEWVRYLRSADPIPRPLLLLKSDDKNIGAAGLKLLLMVVQLHHMLQSVNSAKISKKDQENVPGFAKDLTKGDRRSIHLPKREIWSFGTFSHPYSTFRLVVQNFHNDCLLNSHSSPTTRPPVSVRCMRNTPIGPTGTEIAGPMAPTFRSEASAIVRSSASFA